MTGEVEQDMSEVPTRPLPVKDTVAVGKLWPDRLLPLVILYSPILRLRYRQTVLTCIDQINSACQRIILSIPHQCENHLAVDIENMHTIPPNGFVYIRDSENRYDKEGSVRFFYDVDRVLVAAVLSLPEDENSPYVTLGVTMRKFCELLGVPHVADPDKLHLLSSEGETVLKALYNNL